MYTKRLRALVAAFPRSITFHTADGQAIANIKAKASAFIRNNPQPRAEFHPRAIGQRLI